MKKFAQTIYESWLAETNQRIKLQQAYAAVAIILAAIGGFMVVLTPYFAQYVTMAAAVIALMFVINGVSWALLRGSTDDFATSEKSANTRAKKTTATKRK